MAESAKAVYAAMAGNTAVAITKFIAALASGSSAMLAEAFHSTVDTGNSSLLLLGRRRSKRPADAAHPFGHGQELYFWTFIVAIMIFAVGAGFSMYEGITHLMHPSAPEDPTWNYVVLGLAAVFEGASLYVALKQFSLEAHGQSLWQEFRQGKDPTTFSVVFEDFAALLGIAVALIGIYLAHRYQNPAFDAAGSITIGAILATVAILLARESRGLLLGEAMTSSDREEICRIAARDRDVERVNSPLTMYFGPQTILLAIEVEFAPGLSSAEITGAIDRVERSVSERFPKVKHIFIEAQAISRAAKSQAKEEFNAKRSKPQTGT